MIQSKINLFLYFFIVFINSCQTKSNSENNETVYKFIDSMSFGKKNEFLVENIKFKEKNNTSKIQFNFKHKVGENWILVDSFSREITDILKPNIEFNDFDFDGYNDLSFNSDLGMNGSNEMKTIILFKPNQNGIKVLHNSVEYPNLRINKEKKILVSTIFSGSTKNIFCRIESDTIKRIAMLEFENYLSLTKYFNEKEFSKTIIKDFNCDRYTRFKDYNPIKKE